MIRGNTTLNTATHEEDGERFLPEELRTALSLTLKEIRDCQGLEKGPSGRVSKHASTSELGSQTWIEELLNTVLAHISDK